MILPVLIPTMHNSGPRTGKPGYLALTARSGRDRGQYEPEYYEDNRDKWGLTLHEQYPKEQACYT